MPIIAREARPDEGGCNVCYARNIRIWLFRLLNLTNNGMEFRLCDEHLTELWAEINQLMKETNDE